MIKGYARLGDKTHGVCNHEDHQSEPQPYEVAGKIITASGNITVNNRAVARLGDKVEAECGHISKIITGSDSIVCNNFPLARLGDKIGDGPYEAKIVTASPNTDTEV